MPLYTRFLRWAFTRFYREFAWTYDVVAALVSRGLWQHWIVAVVPYLNGRSVLELGSGTGYLQRALHTQRIRAVGLDASPQMLRRARRKVEQSGSVPNLLQGRAQQLPFPAATFSDVVATFPAEYILERATLAEAWRVLEPGGRLLLIDAAQFAQQDVYSSAVELAYRATQQVRTEDARPRLLREQGFVVREEWVPVRASQVQLLIGTKPDGAIAFPADRGAA
ncbi:MAG: class I SAM-dependent methyltransferase [Chloroflexota bacterium]|nr:class I SAM-dependent methyltransferase [Chloroflexota bacterium]PLS78268.1 MAG: class I SAM-dependent methyltransferase [Chloroflexota bacterium]